MNASNPKNDSLPTLLRVLIPFALAYFLSYLFRVVNAVIAPNLAADLRIGPADLGLLTSAYFISFAAHRDFPIALEIRKCNATCTSATTRAAQFAQHHW